MSLALVPHPSNMPTPLVQVEKITISKQQKAAILLSVLIKANVAPNLDDVSTSSLKDVVEIMANFGDVDRITVDMVVLEFLTELGEFGLSMRDDLEGTLTALKGHVSDKVLDAIRKAFVRSPDVDVWTRIASADAPDIRTCLEGEHIQIAALTLSKIPSTLAAEVLGELDPPHARAVMLAIINAGDITDEVIEIIGNTINDSLFNDTDMDSTDKTSVERAGDIMNYSQSETRSRLLDDFDENDPETAEKIRKVMFIFTDIPDRILPRDVSAVTRAVPPETLLRALKGAQTDAPQAAEFILSSLSSRAAQQLREELEEMEPIKKKDMDIAMNEMIASIRTLESAGTITLIMEDEE